MQPNEIIAKCTNLQNSWDVRRKKFVDWYDVLLLVDELEQEGVESVVTNDPRTSYNLAKHLLTSMIIADKIPNDGLPQEFIPATSYTEKYIVQRWKDQERRYRTNGRQSWQAELVGWMLSLGWYSVFAMVTQDKVWAEVWSPYECYPAYGTDGLLEHARIYTMSSSAANRKVKLMGWTVPKPFTGNDVVFYDYWGFDEDGDAVNAIVADSVFVKVPTKENAVTKVGRLPIFISAVGGLPDMGNIKARNEWQKHYGESIVAVNEALNLNYNKMRSFMQQAARTAAQPHWLETSAGETPIATEQLMNQWGSVLHGSPGEDVRALQGVPIPVELTNIMFLYQTELQKGSLPNAVFGAIQQNLSYLAMANIASAAMQVLVPFKDAIIGLRSDINNFWMDMIRKNGFTPHRYVEPKTIPELEDMRFVVDADLEIPGYLVQKATVARMLNPNFRVPVNWIKEKLFPEILDPLKSLADVRAEDAMMHPKAMLVDNIIAYREQARILHALNDDNADLYDKLAKSLEQELEAATQQIAKPESTPPINPRAGVNVGMPQNLDLGGV